MQEVRHRGGRGCERSPGTSCSTLLLASAKATSQKTGSSSNTDPSGGKGVVIFGIRDPDHLLVGLRSKYSTAEERDEFRKGCRTRKIMFVK